MRLANALRQHAAALDATAPASRWGVVQSVDTAAMTAKALIQPEGVLSGWLPILSPMVGNGWGVVHPPQVGQQVLLGADAGDHESLVILGATWSAKNRPPAGSKPGELWLVHSSGASLKLFNPADDQPVVLSLTAAGATIEMRNNGHVRIADQAGSAIELMNTGTIAVHGVLDVTGSIRVGGTVVAVP